MLKILLLILAIGVSTVSNGVAQNTLRLMEGEESPEAIIGDLAWLEGHWITEALGGTAEEFWAPPRAGAMLGMFRHERNGEISFYELFTVRQVEGSLLLQIKHFQKDMVGWEEKDETVDFALVQLEDKKVWFDGLTMELIDEDHLTVHVRSMNSDGSESELVFAYRRVS